MRIIRVAAPLRRTKCFPTIRARVRMARPTGSRPGEIDPGPDGMRDAGSTSRAPNLERDGSSDTHSAWGFGPRQRYGSVFVCGTRLQPCCHGSPEGRPGTMTVNRPSRGETFEAELIAGSRGSAGDPAVHNQRVGRYTAAYSPSAGRTTAATLPSGPCSRSTGSTCAHKPLVENASPRCPEWTPWCAIGCLGRQPRLAASPGRLTRATQPGPIAPARITATTCHSRRAHGWAPAKSSPGFVPGAWARSGLPRSCGLGREVALKLLPPDLTRDPSRILKNRLD